MNILIDKAGFINKGAELMIDSIIFRLKNEVALKPTFVLNVKHVHLNKLLEKDLFVLAKKTFYKFRYDKYLPARHLKKKYRMIKMEDINLLLDSGGFQFGDQWVMIHRYSNESNFKLSEYYKKFKNNGTKIVFLPQAYGPFENTLSIERIKVIHEHADLIFSRDRKSTEYLLNIIGDSDKIYQYPDFTALLETGPNQLPYHIRENVKDAVGIIPNSKMIYNTDENVSNKYLDFIVNLCKWSIENKEKIVLINHEGRNDYDIIMKIQDKIFHKAIVLNELNALEIKAVIKNLKTLISSRYHGLVSGLNQKIPSFCTSWSHKYEELLRDYNVNDNLIDIKDEKSWMIKVEEVIKNRKHEKYIPDGETIRNIKLLNTEMWEKVLKLIRK
ncbi:MAG: polysaccharide pyruvyl transferase family protein [Promethearchaeota archaeon]